jgi:hypothetical protein
MIRSSISISLMSLLATASIINASSERPFRVTMCSGSTNYNRGPIWSMQEAPHYMPSQRNASSNNSSYQPAPTVINNYYGKKKQGKDGLSNGQKAVGIAGLIAGTVSICKYLYSYVEFGQQVVDVGQQAVDAQKQQQNLEEKKIQQEALKTQAQNEANDLNREFNDEAHEAHAALQGLSIAQLHLLAVSEEESGTGSTYFRKRYGMALLALRNVQKS